MDAAQLAGMVLPSAPGTPETLETVSHHKSALYCKAVPTGEQDKKILTPVPGQEAGAEE